MRPLRYTFLAAVAFLCVRMSVAAEPPGDDPLPKGAKLRLGSDRPSYRVSPTGALLPPDYKTFLIPDAQLGFRRFDASTGKLLGGGKGGGGAGGHVVVSGDGTRAVVAHTGILTVRDTVTGKAIQELKPPAGFGTFATSTGPHVALSGDGKVLAQGVTNLKANTSEVLVWDVDKGTVLERFETLQKGGALPVLSADGKLLATRGTTTAPFVPPGAKDDDSGRTIQIWNIGEKKELFKARVSPGGFQITACAFSPDGTLLAAGCADGPVDLWDVKAQKPKATLLGRTGQGLRVAFSPDGTALAAVATDGAIQRWATADGKPLATTEPPTELPTHAAHGLAFAGNDRVVAWGAVGAAAVAWEAPSGKFLTPLGEHTAGIRSIGFADGGKQIVTAGLDGRVVKWDAATGKPAGAVTVRPSRAAGLQPRLVLNLAPDASRAVNVVTAGGPAAVFDLTTGAELFAIPRGTSVGFTTYTIPSADAARAVTVAVPFDARKNPNGTVIVWDLTARKKVIEVELAIGPGLPPTAAISPSGDRLIVARYAKSDLADQTVLVVTGYDLKTGKKLGDVEDHKASGALFVAAASETTALVSSGAGRLRAFNYEDGRGGDEIETAGRGEHGGAVVFGPDGKRFAFGVATDEPDVFGVRVYDWPSGKALHTFAGHRGPVTALAFSADGKTLASGSADTTVLLWDVTAIPKP